jgi:hypothetical protein
MRIMTKHKTWRGCSDLFAFLSCIQEVCKFKNASCETALLAQAGGSALLPGEEEALRESVVAGIPGVKKTVKIKSPASRSASVSPAISEKGSPKSSPKSLKPVSVRICLMKFCSA